MNKPPLYILQNEPLAGYTPAEALRLLASISDEQAIADIYAAVFNHVISLSHELDADDPWVWEAYDAWRDVEDVTYQHIWNMLKAENDSGKTKHVLSGIGTYYIIKPFMLRNGYRDGRGWWIKS